MTRTLLDKLDSVSLVRSIGKVRSVVGFSIRAVVPQARVGEVVSIKRRGSNDLAAIVVGFDQDAMILMPLGTTEGVAPNDDVECSGESFSLPCSDALLGRVIDGLGQPLDGKGAISGSKFVIDRPAPSPFSRPLIRESMATGVRVLDGLLSMGRGQRVGLFAGSGVGKSTLLGQIAKHADADVVVVALIGERGREVQEFLTESLTAEARQRAVVVAATSDTPALVRLMSAQVATSVAEYFRDQGKNVLLLMDSVTRFARAAREVGLAAGELPARRGYPPSVFAMLPRLLERTGPSEIGTITAIYTVLVEGGDLDEPVADEVRGILDGHWVLSRELAERGRFPAIDVLASVSRVMDQVVTDDHRARARRVRELIGTFESKRDLISVGAYKKGADPALDVAVEKMPAIEKFLRQSRDEHVRWDETLRNLKAL